MRHERGEGEGEGLPNKDGLLSSTLSSIVPLEESEQAPCALKEEFCLTPPAKALAQFPLASRACFPENLLMLNNSLRTASAISLVTFGLLGLASVRGVAAETYTENPGASGDGSFTIGPDYSVDPDLTDKGNPKGKAFQFSLVLADSKIFRGDDATLNPEKKPVLKERKIFVYVPAAYHDGTKAAVLVIQDGPGQLGLVRNALDNLTISGSGPQAAPVHRRRRAKRRQRRQKE